jgi:AraC-like DNA-binding protein
VDIEPAAFEYLQREPVGPLRRYVELLWYAKGMSTYRSERIAPTGSTVLGIVLGDAILQIPRNGAGEPYSAVEGFVIAPHDQPIINAPTGLTHCVGIVTTAIGCRAALGIDPAGLRGRVTPATGWRGFEGLRSELRAVPAGDLSGATALRMVEDTLAAGCTQDSPALARSERVVAMLLADPAASIAGIAAGLGISHGHLDREFTRVTGLGPRTFGRILRLRRLVESIDVYGTVHWTSLAAELGWFDQAHLIRDFKRFTGVTPSQYLASQRSGYPLDEAEPGFVPDLGQRRPGT